MANLYSKGWRQGTIFSGDLPVLRLALGEDGEPVDKKEIFGRWVVCSQNCDLAAADIETDSQPAVEIRPASPTDDVPLDWGVRSRRFRLTDTEMTESDAPRTLVTPGLLQSFAGSVEQHLSDGRARAFKTWLGLRYDRPAVPDHLVGPAREIARRCGGRSGRSVAEGVHDVLMQFNDAQDPPQVILFVIRADDADEESVRLWVADAAQQIRDDVCVVAGIEVGTRADTSLELLASSYAADLSQLTWGGTEPTGAE